MPPSFLRMFIFLAKHGLFFKPCRLFFVALFNYVAGLVVLDIAGTRADFVNPVALDLV